MGVKTDNLAIMFTDIVGYTAGTSRRSRDAQADWQARHEGLLLPIFKAFGGKVIKTIGDAFLVTYRSPTDAVLCGTAVQDVLAAYNAEAASQDQIRVRVVINIGEVRLDRGDIFGEAVNIAARLEGLADAGDVVFSEAVYLAMNRSEVPSEPMGEHQLKGLPEPLRVHRVPPHQHRKLVAVKGQNADAETPTDALQSEQNPAQNYPYGGLALARLQASGFNMSKLGQLGLSDLAGQKIAETLRSVSDGLGEVKDQVMHSGLVDVAPRSHRLSRLMWGLSGAFLLLVLGVALWLNFADSGGLAVLIKAADAQDWSAAKQELQRLENDQAISPAKRQAARAYLNSAQGKSGQALSAYQKAFALDARLCQQPALMEDVAAYLDDRAGEAVNILRSCNNDADWSRLSKVIDDDKVSPGGRLSAARLLRDQGLGNKKQILHLAREVFASDASCTQRKLAVYLLGELGDMSDVELLQQQSNPEENGQNPLDLVARQIGHAAANACMGGADKRAAQEIKKRNK